MSVICHNVNTQNLKIARIDRPHILASHLLHIDIGPVTKIFQGLYTQKIERLFLSVSKYIYSFYVADQDTVRHSFCLEQKKIVSLAEPYTTDS